MSVLGRPKQRHDEVPAHFFFLFDTLPSATAAMAASETASERAAAKKCDFWLEKKNRKCGMLVKAGETRCGNHLEHGPERVACAHCKTSVSALGLEKHLRKCPALAHATARTRAPYFVRDVNAGDASAASLAAAVASRPPRGDALRAFAARVRAACARERIEPGTPREDPRDNERCRLATRARRDAQRLAATRGGAVPPPLEPRHAAQHASIVAHMADAGLVHGTDDEDESSAQKNAPHSENKKQKPLFVELGAGRGYLSHFLLDAYGPLDLVLVEREAVRFKAERSMGADAARRRDAQTRDSRRLAQKRRALAKASPIRTFRENVENKKNPSSPSDNATFLRADGDVLEKPFSRSPSGGEYSFDDARAERDAETVRVRRAGASVERLRVDIKDLRFSGVAAAENRDVVFVAKHLCGAATDLALRCALAPDDDALPKKTFRARGACIATCCHHRCEWGSYVNRAFVEAHGFDAREFGWLARISSWAADGAAGAHHGEDSKSTSSFTERDDECARDGSAGSVSVAKKPRRDRAKEKEKEKDETRGFFSTNDATDATDAIDAIDAVPRDGPDVSALEKLELGRLAKTFLDVGRLRFLESRGFEGSVRGYCAAETSPENRLLVAARAENDEPL